MCTPRVATKQQVPSFHFFRINEVILKYSQKHKMQALYSCYDASVSKFDLGYFQNFLKQWNTNVTL